MNTKKKYIIFKKSMAGVITILALSVLILSRGHKTKLDFQHVKGKLIYVEKTFEELPNRHLGKYRYLKLESFPKTFELFVGKDFGDFKPEFERIDNLRVGNEIDIYFDENSTETDLRINRLVQFIDKNEEPIFIRSGKDKSLGYILFALGFILGTVLFYLKKIGKIE
jgi:hypothetical protein